MIHNQYPTLFHHRNQQHQAGDAYGSAEEVKETPMPCRLLPEGEGEEDSVKDYEHEDGVMSREKCGER